MISINIIGTGNVAWHIAAAIQTTSTHRLQAVAGRSENARNDFNSFTTHTTSVTVLTPADITMIIVSDDAIKDLIKSIPYKTGLFVHTSGSVPRSVLDIFENNGVFYPLQSFSKGVPVNFSKIPICIESKKKDNLELLTDLGFALSEKVTQISSEQRQKLHLAAVFVNNFSNHCFTIAQDICEENDLSFDLLRTLLETTAIKALTNRPDTIQTGPAKRNDQATLATHKSFLTHVKQQEIYTILSEAITSYYGNKL